MQLLLVGIVRKHRAENVGRLAKLVSLKRLKPFLVQGNCLNLGCADDWRRRLDGCGTRFARGLVWGRLAPTGRHFPRFREGRAGPDPPLLRHEASRFPVSDRDEWAKVTDSRGMGQVPDTLRRFFVRSRAA
jgi:hypothetical protein